MIFYPGVIEVCLLQCLSNLSVVLLLCSSQWTGSGAPVLVTVLADGETASMHPHLSSPDVLPGSHWPACSFFTGVQPAPSLCKCFLSTTGKLITHVTRERLCLPLFPSPNWCSDFNASCCFWTLCLFPIYPTFPFSQWRWWFSCPCSSPTFAKLPCFLWCLLASFWVTQVPVTCYSSQPSSLT